MRQTPRPFGWSRNLPVPPASRMSVRLDTSRALNHESPGQHDLQFPGPGAKCSRVFGYSNLATATTLPIPKTVFLIHGLNQGPIDMRSLATNLAATYGLTAGRFRIDYGFDFSDCADATLAFCSSIALSLAGHNVWLSTS